MSSAKSDPVVAPGGALPLPPRLSYGEFLCTARQLGTNVNHAPQLPTLCSVPAVPIHVCISALKRSLPVHGTVGLGDLGRTGIGEDGQNKGPRLVLWMRGFEGWCSWLTVLPAALSAPAYHIE